MFVLNTKTYCDHEYKFQYHYNSDYVKECNVSGYYYLSSAQCKKLVISAGAGGILVHEAIEIVYKQIKNNWNLILDFVPPLKFLNQKINSYYAPELAECLVKAAMIGTGIDITIGYPELVVIKLA